MKAEEIFLAAVEKKKPGERAAYLEDACRDAAALRAQVAALLQSHEQAGSFLEQPLFVSSPTCDTSALAEGPGTRIGPYKLLQQIGEGGMGVVYMAEQQQPVRRKVALKIIKPGLDSRQVSARFEAERQALAMMEHQNIAKVLDAGATESGRPYFVMELVHGVPLTKYCDDHQLTPRQRLELFLPVCHAVQHAHQKGIIHRDLKPSNLLVTMYDDKPVPKVIDFGVAKAVEHRLTEKTLFTQFGTLVGTFEYMSPEQAELNAFGVDTRSDIYSLGVLLYELLTGSTPLERQRLREAAYGDIVRLIKEEEAPRPSTRLSNSGAALAGISQQRGSEPGKLTQLVCGELDWIVMRCLEKDRTRRYETANGLARDVERYLKDEPVEACPPTAGYKLRKFARKNNKLFATAAAFAALLLLGVAASAWQAVRATQAEAVALANGHQANANAAQANQQRDEARALAEKLQAALEQLRRTTYAAHMNLAQHAWEAGGIRRVGEILEQHRPKPGETDLRGFEWHYLHRLCHPELLTLKGHTDGVHSVAFSPDGKRLASASKDWTVKVWEAQTGQELLTLKDHSGTVLSVAFSPDGKRLASGSSGWSNQQQKVPGEVKVWDAQTGQELLTLKGYTGYVDSVAFSPDGKRLASGGTDSADEKGKLFQGKVKVWDAQTGQELLSLKGHTGDVDSVVFSPDGKRLASASGDDKTVKVWDAHTGQELRVLKGHTGGSMGVAFSPDGKRLASSGGGVKVWDAQTGQELLSLLQGGGGNVAFSPDGKRLASASWNEPMVKVWDAQTGQETLTLRGHTGGVGGLAFSPDGKRLASASLDGTVKIWDATTSQEPRPFSGHTGRVVSVVFSPDGKRLASASQDRTVKVWDAQTGQELRTFKRPGHVVFSPDGKRLASASASSEDKTVKVWDTQTGQELLSLKGIGVWSVAFSPDGKRLACAAYDQTVKVWDAQTGQELLTLMGGGSNVAFSPDGKRLASGRGDPSGRPGAVKVWDAQTGQELLSLKGQFGGVFSVAFSPDGKRLACASGGDRTVKVWDAQTGQELLTCKGHIDRVFSVVFSPDGKRLASGSRTWDATKKAHVAGEMKVWDAQTGQELLTLKGHAGYVSKVVFSPDGHRLASGAADGTVTIWDATPLPEKP